MEPVYIETTINDTLIRINKNDALDVYSWRDWVKTPYWYKMTPCILTNKFGYKRYRVKFNSKQCILSRLVYKAHNPDWDITDTSNNNFVDHINNNSLDNRIENLRILTNQQNQWNNKDAKGYYFNKTKKRWYSYIRINKTKKFIGSFKEEADARNAYLEAKSLYHHIA